MIHECVGRANLEIWNLETYVLQKAGNQEIQTLETSRRRSSGGVSIYIYIYMVPPPPLTYPFAPFETQAWVGAGGSVMERRPENAQD